VRARRTVRDWRRAVLRSSQITDSTRVLLLVLAEHVRDHNLQVSVPRKDLARWLNRSERRITERITAAHDAGLLDTVSPGHRGRTAVYAVLFADEKRGTKSSPLLGTENRPAIAGESGTPGGPTSTTANPSPDGSDRNVGSYEKPATTEAAIDQPRRWENSA